MDTPNTTTSDSTDDDNTQLVATGNWANKRGYKVAIPTYDQPGKLKGYTPKFRSRRLRELAALAPRNNPQPANTAPQANPLDVDLAQPMRVAKAFKGGSDKKTCLVDVGGKQVVVKGGSGNVDDHIAATNLIARLNLKGVRAPATRNLTDAERRTIAAALANQGADAAQLAASLTTLDPQSGESSGLMAEPVAGKALDALILNANQEKARNSADTLRQRVSGKGQDSAWADACAALKDTIPNQKNPKWAEIDKRSAANDANTRKVALDWFRDNLVTPEHVAMVQVLVEIDQNTVADAMRRSQEEAQATQQAAAKLKAFAKSPQGVEAFGGVAVCDLLVGMDDRLIGKQNGGNFLFDDAKGELVCVDNSKSVDKHLNSPKLADYVEQAPGRRPAWEEFVNATLTASKGTTLAEAIFASVYEKKDKSNPSIPANYVTFDDNEKAAAIQKIQEILVSTVQAVEAGEDPAGPAFERGAFLKARLELEDLFRVDPKMATPPDLPEKISTGEKLERMAKGLAVSKKTREETQKIKDKLRSGAYTAEQAKAKLIELQDASKTLKDDRRSKKLDFLIAAAVFRGHLSSLALGIANFQKTAPKGAWMPAVVAQMSAPLRSAVAVWRDALVKDAKTLKQLDTVWKQFPDEVRGV